MPASSAALPETTCTTSRPSGACWVATPRNAPEVDGLRRSRLAGGRLWLPPGKLGACWGPPLPLPWLPGRLGAAGGVATAASSSLLPAVADGVPDAEHHGGTEDARRGSRAPTWAPRRGSTRSGPPRARPPGLRPRRAPAAGARRRGRGGGCGGDLGLRWRPPARAGSPRRPGSTGPRPRARAPGVSARQPPVSRGPRERGSRGPSGLGLRRRRSVGVSSLTGRPLVGDVETMVPGSRDRVVRDDCERSQAGRAPPGRCRPGGGVRAGDGSGSERVDALLPGADPHRLGRRG